MELPEVSREGLESVFDWGARIKAELESFEREFVEARDGGDLASLMPMSHHMSHLGNQLDLAVTILDQVLPRGEGLSWREEMQPEKRPDAMPDVEPGVGSDEPRPGESTYIDRG
jgi:hypothetical protein